MFNLDEMYNTFMESYSEKDKPEIIKISVIVEPDNESMYENIISGDKNTSYDDQTLDDWYDFAATVEGIVDNLCDVVNISCSKNNESLSEYIDFYVYDQNGNKKNYLIDLRLSDHSSNGRAREVRKNKAKRIDTKFVLRAITVNKSTYKSYSSAIRAVRLLIADEMV